MTIFILPHCCLLFHYVTCQIAKNHCLPYSRNERRLSHVLDLIHYDIWGPSPVKSTSGFIYYVLFIDDYSRFTWLYPLKLKSKFYDIFIHFQNLVENQHFTRIKNFQVMVVLSLQAIASNPTSAPRVFIINSLAPILPPKMASLKENTDM